jgi:hypothetical protein
MDLFAAFPKKVSKKDDFDSLKARLETYLSEILLLEVLNEVKCLRDWLDLDTVFQGPPDTQWFSGLQLMDEIRANTEKQLNAAVEEQEAKIREVTEQLQQLTSKTDLSGIREWAQSRSSKASGHDEVLDRMRQIEDGELELAQLKHKLFDWYGFTADYLECTISPEALRLMEKVEESSMTPNRGGSVVGVEDGGCSVDHGVDQPTITIAASDSADASSSSLSSKKKKKKSSRGSILPWRSSKRNPNGSDADASASASASLSPRSENNNLLAPSNNQTAPQSDSEPSEHQDQQPTSPKQQQQSTPDQAQPTHVQIPLLPPQANEPQPSDNATPSITTSDSATDEPYVYSEPPPVMTRKATLTLTVSRADAKANAQVHQQRVRKVMRFSMMLREQQEVIRIRNNAYRSGMPPPEQ